MLTEVGLYRLLGESPERTWPVARRLVIPIARVIVPTYGYGGERLPESGPVVVAANHFSEVDPAILGLHSRRTIYYMAKIELLSVPVVGELLRWTGAFAVRRGEGDRDSLRMARWVVREGHALGMFAEGTRQQLGHPGPMHPGAAMIAIQEDVPLVPCGIDTFGWTLRNRRPCSIVWGEPIRLDLPRTGKGYKEGAAVVGEIVADLWRQAAQATADGFPDALPDGARRSVPIPPRQAFTYPELPRWPEDEWAAGPLGPIYRNDGRTAVDREAPGS
jgi:1-acyl-sn-glycerol-3-phosphate acyltransferase